MAGEVTLERKTDGGITTITFGYTKGNALPRILLYSLAEEIEKVGKDPQTKVVLLQSMGEKNFCAGALFDELLISDTLEKARGIFGGFSRIFLAMRSCPHLIVARVQGKVVGGGVGIVCAADYTVACEGADAKLSELTLGIAPLTIGPLVQRKIGLSSFAEMAYRYIYHHLACEPSVLYIAAKKLWD